MKVVCCKSQYFKTRKTLVVTFCKTNDEAVWLIQEDIPFRLDLSWSNRNNAQLRYLSSQRASKHDYMQKPLLIHLNAKRKKKNVILKLPYDIGI